MRNDSERLIVKYPRTNEFLGILEDAKMMASNSKALDFVQSVEEKFKAYGGRMYWSVAQDRFLRSIAMRD